MPRRRSLAALAALSLLLAACGDDDADGRAAPAGGDHPTVVVTTTTLTDVVEHLVGDQADVVGVMPVGADPHDFQPSAQQVDAMGRASGLVVNGAGFEEGLLDVIDAAEEDGVPTYEAITEVATIEFGEAAHGDVDPHFFQDPSRMAVAAAGVGRFLVENVDGIDAQAVRARVEGYVDELQALDREVADLLSAVPDDRRVLVTNHDSFGYFADRYGFEVVGTVIPSGSTSDGAGAGALADLAETIREEQVPAIFTENVASSDLARALAAEVGDEVDVVELFTDSLTDDGDAGSYVEMIRTNAERIASALA